MSKTQSTTQMEEIKLYKSPLKSLRLLFLSSLFVIPSLWLLLKNEKAETSLLFCLCFFGIGFLLSLFNIVDRRPQIILNKNGVWDRSTNEEVIKWEIIKSANEINIYKQIFVCLKLDKSFVPKKKQYSWAKKLNNSIGAKDVNLNVSYIKVNIEKLMTLITLLSQEKIENREELLKLYSSKL